MTNPIASNKTASTDAADEIVDGDFSLATSSARETVDQVRNQSERIRREELETALRHLNSHGELTCDDRQMLTRLSSQITGALVESWVSKLTDEGVDSELARELILEDK